MLFDAGYTVVNKPAMFPDFTELKAYGRKRKQLNRYIVFLKERKMGSWERIGRKTYFKMGDSIH